MTTEPHAHAPYDLPPLRASLARTGVRIALVVLVAYGVHLGIDWVMAWSEGLGPRVGPSVRFGVIGVVLLVYAALIAVPFVPGIEIGLSLILMRGTEIAPYVYIATVGGLVLAYLAGRFLSYAWLRRIALDLRLVGACRILDTIRPLTPDERLELLRARLPRWLGHIALTYRYPLLAGLINLPGSALIGGGGGICLVAGLTHVFRPRATILTIALAVLPVPLALWIWGPGILRG